MSATRKAEFDRILQSGLDLIQQGEPLEATLERFPEHAQDLRPLLESAAWLQQTQSALQPRPGFLPASRRRLIQRIQAHPRPGWRRWGALPIGAGSSWQPFWAVHYRFQIRLAYLALILFMLLINVRQLSLALPTWLPGDAPYPLKTTLEDARLVLTPGAAAQARLHIEFARRRLTEVQGLVFEGRYEQLAPTVADFEAHVGAATRLLQALAVREPQQAQALAVLLKGTLLSQNGLFPLLARSTPPADRAQFEHIHFVVENGVQAMQGLFLPNGRLPTSPWLASACPPPGSAGGQSCLALPPYRFVGLRLKG